MENNDLNQNVKDSNNELLKRIKQLEELTDKFVPKNEDEQTVLDTSKEQLKDMNRILNALNNMYYISQNIDQSKETQKNIEDIKQQFHNLLDKQELLLEQPIYQDDLKNEFKDMNRILNALKNMYYISQNIDQSKETQKNTEDIKQQFHNILDKQEILLEKPIYQDNVKNEFDKVKIDMENTEKDTNQKINILIKDIREKLTRINESTPTLKNK